MKYEEKSEKRKEDRVKNLKRENHSEEVKDPEASD